MSHDVEDDAGPWRPVRRLNLNQLYMLDAILKTPTLTEAGRMAGLSQPAMSMALRKLREHFADDLVRYGAGERSLTAMGHALRQRVGHALRVADDTFTLRLDFDPGTARRSIAIAAPEEIELMFLGTVVRRLLAEAPGIDVRLVPFDYRSVAGLFDHGADVVLTPATMAAPGMMSRPLFDLSTVGMVWTGSSWRGDRMSAEEYLAARHVALFAEMERAALYGAAMDPLLARRTVVARTGLYSMLPNLVVGTDLVATMTGWLAQYYAHMLPVRLIEIPTDAPPVEVVVQWQPHRDREPAIRWLIGHVAGAVDWSAPRDRDHPTD